MNEASADPDVNNQPRITRWHNRRRVIPSRSGTIREEKVQLMQTDP